MLPTHPGTGKAAGTPRRLTDPTGGASPRANSGIRLVGGDYDGSPFASFGMDSEASFESEPLGGEGMDVLP
jgi:hypothetical protein